MTTGVIEHKVDEPPAVASWRWERWALLGVLAVAALLYSWDIGDRALQPYYAAAVRSMTESGHAFLFAGYDPAGVVSIDKTPLAFWVQGIGVWIFGYHWWAIALVQAVEGVASVFVLHLVVRRWAGPRPALLAAAILALSPINTAIARANQADGLMVLLLLLAAYCVTRAVEQSDEPGWLIWAGVFVGLAFFAKMLAAWIVLPALGLAYLAAPISWPKRLLRLLLAGLVCAAVSLAWPELVSLWPAGDRPFVGSTTSNSIWDLIFGYNGFGRVSGGSIGSLGNALGSYGTEFGGAPGIGRLFGPELAGQVGWLLPVALGAVVVEAIVWVRTREGTPVRRAGWLLWGGWLIIAGLVFSLAGGIFHRYYTVELAPAIAAVVAVGLAAAWGWYRAGRPLGLLVPLVVAVTSGYAYLVLDDTPDWQPWLRVAVPVIGLLSVVGLLLAFPGRRLARPAMLVGIVAMLLAPLGFSVDTMLTPQTVITAADPSAGPSTNDVAASVRGALGQGNVVRAYVNFMSSAGTLTTGQREVLDYVTGHAPNARVQLGVELGSWGADPYLLHSSVRVVALGGYIGLDPAPTAAQLAALARQHQLGYVLLPGILRDLSRAGTNNSRRSTAPPRVDASSLAGRIQWVTTHCVPVAPSEIGPAAAQAGILFDCQPR